MALEAMRSVLALRGLPRGRVSRAFLVEDLKRKLEDLDLEQKQIYLDLDRRGFLTATNQGNATLPPVAFTAIPLASDVQNRNLELFQDGNEWSVRLLKDVAPEQAIELWFSEDVLAKLDMPFLTPRNIKGRKSYVCHECNLLFEQPNPLKVHLFLSCQHYTIRRFWKRFFTKITEVNLPLNLTIGSFFPPKTILNTDRPKSHENTSEAQNKHISRCNSEPPFSAFKPYSTSAVNWYAHLNNNPVLPHFLPPNLGLNAAIKSRLTYNNLLRVSTVSKSLERISVTNPAEIEVLATNWGKSKEGHLCLYCGKVYSRKYGLKIHIRTHTGYKPLQCKYCLRPFGDPSNLNKHVRLHAQCETPYSCHLCGKMLVRKRDLERHLRSRHDEAEVRKIDSIVRESPSP